MDTSIRVGRPAVRQQKALEVLRGGPRTVFELAKALGIAGNNCRRILGDLRADQKVQVLGVNEDGDRPAKVWGLMPTRVKCQWEPVRQMEQESAERARWIAELLDKWERFMRSYWGPQGYPQSSSGMPARARIQSFEDMEEEIDRFMVSACDACIDDLPDHLRSAIYYHHRLVDRWCHPGHPQDTIETAIDLLLFKLKGRVAVP